jgi:lysophospholipase L1-like esterase
MGVDVAINQDGLREREVNKAKGPGVFRIAMVGDSITFGWGVAQDQTLSRQLELLLNRQRPLGDGVRFEVVNFGVGNYSIADVAAMLEAKALAYSPDLVVYGAFINDAEVPESHASSLLLRHSLFATWVWGRLDALWRSAGWRQDYREYYAGLYAEGSDGRLLVRSNLSAMAELCSAKNIPLVVAFLPELHVESQKAFDLITDYYATETTAAGAQFVDLYKLLPAQEPDRFWVSHDDAHPNAEAFGLYASGLFAEIPWNDYAVGETTSVQGKQEK